MPDRARLHTALELAQRCVDLNIPPAPRDVDHPDDPRYDHLWCEHPDSPYRTEHS